MESEINKLQDRIEILKEKHRQLNRETDAGECSSMLKKQKLHVKDCITLLTRRLHTLLHSTEPTSPTTKEQACEKMAEKISQQTSASVSVVRLNAQREDSGTETIGPVASSARRA